MPDLEVKDFTTPELRAVVALRGTPYDLFIAALAELIARSAQGSILNATDILHRSSQRPG